MSTDQLRALEERIETLEYKLQLPKLMTARQVCDLLQISEVQFYAWRRAGDSPPSIHVTSRTVRYDVDDVLHWAASKKVGAGA